MNWFPMLATFAVVIVEFFGFQNPSRAFSLLLCLAVVVFLWMAIEGWKMLRPTAGTLRLAGKRSRLS